MSEAFHPMRAPEIQKVVVHVGVGEGGRDLQNAEAILEDITEQTSVRTLAKETVPEFGIREGEPIGAKVTLRGADAEGFLEVALPLVDIDRHQFDETGNVSFGIAEHTDFPGQEYDPTIGIHGLDVTVHITRPGRRIVVRDHAARSIPSTHRLSKEDAITAIEEKFGVEVG